MRENGTLVFNSSVESDSTVSLKTIMKKIKIIAIFTLVFLVIIGLAFLSESSKKTQQNTLVNNNIVPGKTTAQDIKKIYGEPKKEYTDNDHNILEYSSKNHTRNEKFYLDKENALDLYREIVSFNKTISEIKNVYGETKDILYGTDSKAGFFLYVYPLSGIAYLGNPNGKTALLEIWHFTPVKDLEEFKSKYAPDYSDQIQTEKYP